MREQGLEGLVAKRRDSLYEAGRRSGAWQKMRINQGQELVIGGYTMGGKTFDALVLRYYEDEELVYASRTLNGFTPALREQLYKKMKPLEIAECPFANLPEGHGRESLRCHRPSLYKRPVGNGGIGVDPTMISEMARTPLQT